MNTGPVRGSREKAEYPAPAGTFTASRKSLRRVIRTGNAP